MTGLNNEKKNNGSIKKMTTLSFRNFEYSPSIVRFSEKNYNARLR